MLAASDTRESDLIAYRRLRREDFRGPSPPSGFAAYTAQIGAATCAHILTAPNLQIQIEGERDAQGTVHYRGAPKNLVFHARMDRNCSWWNPEDLGIPRDYILEHEQIHFALVELEARRMNAASAAMAERLRVSGESPQDVSTQLEARLAVELETHMKRVLARSREFDEDTSMGHNPGAQKRWLRRVEAELAELRVSSGP